MAVSRMGPVILRGRNGAREGEEEEEREEEEREEEEREGRGALLNMREI